MRIGPLLTMPLLLCVASIVFAASLEERASAAFANIELRADQQDAYQAIVADYYKRQADMYKRSMRQSSGPDVTKLVRNRNRGISADTVKKMRKVLDPQQLEQFQYAIDLADRSFLESVGAK
jgi:hypothetical protein